LRERGDASLRPFEAPKAPEITQTYPTGQKEDWLSCLLFGPWNLEEQPLETVDINGVGEMMKMAVDKGRKTKPNLKIGICGVHGGEPRSVFFCHKIGLDYVSCSAYQVPIARLAAAQVVLMEKRKIEISGD
jgi:phosphoenolpyruvate synthase/pyruvate phosphate dikinase